MSRTGHQVLTAVGVIAALALVVGLYVPLVTQGALSPTSAPTGAPTATPVMEGAVNCTTQVLPALSANFTGLNSGTGTLTWQTYNYTVTKTQESAVIYALGPNQSASVTQTAYISRVAVNLSATAAFADIRITNSQVCSAGFCSGRVLISNLEMVVGYFPVSCPPIRTSSPVTSQGDYPAIGPDESLIVHAYIILPGFCASANATTQFVYSFDAQAIDYDPGCSCGIWTSTPACSRHIAPNLAQNIFFSAANLTLTGTGWPIITDVLNASSPVGWSYSVTGSLMPYPRQ